MWFRFRRLSDAQGYVLSEMTVSFLLDDDEKTLSRALAALRQRQHDDGHWVFDLEADATITAEYIMLEHFMGRVTSARQAAMARHLRRKQTAAGGGWPLFQGGDLDLSVSVKAYFALKLAGDPIDAPHMVRARRAILAEGGAAQANVFTQIQLALFGIIPWHVLPAMPVELVLLTRKAPVSIWAVSYWSRTCIVPLLVIQALRPAARNPSGLGLDELFEASSVHVRHGTRQKSVRWRGMAFRALDFVLKRLDPAHSRRLRTKAIAVAVAYVEERLNGVNGLGAIYPAIGYSLMMFDALGRGPDDPAIRTVWKALDRLVVDLPTESYCQPCLSPVWDTALAGHAMMTAIEAGTVSANPADVRAACDWLVERQITTVRGDWCAAAVPELQPGGWAFQYRNDYFPDVDDTSVVAMLLLRLGRTDYALAIERARRWILGMQCRNGGWGAFDVDNDRGYLNDIPFADHGALLDPATADVTARCVSFLAQLGHEEDRATIDRALAFLEREQEPDGSWFGRWGTNYIYGTWSVLSAFADAGLSKHPAVARAARWLASIQRLDGGWGEDERSYELGHYLASPTSRPSQTAWAMLALMAARYPDQRPLERASAWLEKTCSQEGTWHETNNAVGFPKVFYLTYKGYSLYFPIMALAHARKLSIRPSASSRQ